MKKLLSTIALTTGAFLLFAQVQIQVPQAVHQAFKDGHPNHDFITWEMEGSNYKGSSIDPQQLHHITVYDQSGRIVRSESELSAMDVPMNINEYNQKNFPNQTNDPVWMVVDQKGNRSFYSVHKDTKIEFDKNGAVIKN